MGMDVFLMIGMIFMYWCAVYTGGFEHPLLFLSVVTNIIAHIATSCNIFTSSIRNMNKTLITLRTSPFKMAALGGERLILANQNSLYHASWRPRLPNVFESVRRAKTGRKLEALLGIGRLTGFLHACNYTIPRHLLHR